MEISILHRLKMRALWDNNWEVNGPNYRFILSHDPELMNQLKDIVEDVELKGLCDIQDVFELHFHYPGDRWLFIFVGNIYSQFITVHVYGQSNKSNSYEIYDKDGEVENYGKL